MFICHGSWMRRVVALALRRLHEGHTVIPEPPVNCDAKDGWDQTGRMLFR